MAKRLPCPPAPGPREEDDARLGTLTQRRGFGEYLQGVLPRDWHQTRTGLVGTEPVVGA